MDIRESLVDWLRRIKYSLDSNKDTVKETNEKLDEVITEVKKDKKVDLSPVNEILKKDKNVTETFITTVDEHEKVLSMTKHFDNDNNLITTKFWDGKVEIPEPSGWKYIASDSSSTVEINSIKDKPYQVNLKNSTLTISNPVSISYTIVSGDVMVITPDGVSISFPIEGNEISTEFSFSHKESGDFIFDATNGNVYITYTK